jgi:CheY-like chemotaxis protein
MRSVSVGLNREVTNMYDVVAVDDSVVICSLLRRVFKSLGWSACVVNSAKEALQAIEGEGAHVLVTDINMPGMTGAVLARKVRELYPDMPIVALTASVLESELNPADFTQVLAKPFRVSHITRVLSGHLAASRGESGIAASIRNRDEAE